MHAASQASALAPEKCDSEAVKFRRAADHLLDGDDFKGKVCLCLVACRLRVPRRLRAPSSPSFRALVVIRTPPPAPPPPTPVRQSNRSSIPHARRRRTTDDDDVSSPCAVPSATATTTDDDRRRPTTTDDVSSHKIF